MTMTRYNLKINGKIVAIADRYCIMSVAEDLLCCGIQDFIIEFRDTLNLHDRPEDKEKK